MFYKLTLPDIGEGVVEAEVLRWFVQPGDPVAEDQPLVEVMTDKATVTIPSPRRGTVLRLCCEVGQTARVHAPLLELDAQEPAAVEEGTPAAALPAGECGAPEHGGAPLAAAAPGRLRALATPAVRALAREMGLDLQAVPGSGPDGRVTRQDLVTYRGAVNGQGGEREVPTATLASLAPPSPGPEERIPLAGLRKRIAENMTRAARTTAHFTFVEQVDVTELVRVKHRIADAGRKEGVKVTYLPFVVKAVVAALRDHPLLNASLDEARGEIVLKHWYDIGIASATDAGLLVPVVRGADRRSLLDLAREISRLAADAKAGRSPPADLGRSTFTITSLGALGGLFATPVLNLPEVGILGVHRIRPTPVVRDGQIVVRDVMHLSLTGDHRVVDGQEAAAFTYRVIRYLEDPTLLFMRMV